MDTDILRLINGAVIECNKAHQKIEDTGDIESERLDRAYDLLGRVIVLLQQELEAQENV